MHKHVQGDCTSQTNHSTPGTWAAFTVKGIFCCVGITPGSSHVKTPLIYKGQSSEPPCPGAGVCGLPLPPSGLDQACRSPCSAQPRPRAGPAPAPITSSSFVHLHHPWALISFHRLF